MRGVERFWALFYPEAIGIVTSVALKDKESNALQNLARLTSLPVTMSQGPGPPAYFGERLNLGQFHVEIIRHRSPP